MFAAVDAHGSITDPFSVSWSSTPLLPRQWYTVPSEPTELQISHGSSYGIIILLAGSLQDGSEPESKPLTH
jgi:hypothetical protein